MTKSIDPVAFRHSLLKLLEALPPREDRLLTELEAQEKRGTPVYSALINILSHLNFSEREARRHWGKIRNHRRRLEGALGRDVGLRVALLDYFVNMSRELKNPKVIEISIYESTEREAITDGLTGLTNHAHFLQVLRRELQRSKRHDLQMSVVLFDLDNFKRINDTYGHLEGDRFLVKAAALIKESLREIDVAARYGGEEFAVLLPDTPATGAHVVADRVRAKVEAHFRRRKGVAVATISGGVATFPADGEDIEAVMRKADEALYRSKADGKNRITLASGERRQHLRTSVGRRALVTSNGGRAHKATMKNVSDGGLLLFTRQPLAVGTSVHVDVPITESTSVRLDGVIVRVRKEPGEKTGFDVGFRLHAPLASQPLDLLLRDARPASA